MLRKCAYGAVLALGLGGLLLSAGCGGSPVEVEETADRVATLPGANPTLASDDPVLVGAGDMHADCVGTTDSTTAALLDGIAGTVFTLGDNTESGTAGDFENCYQATWGRHKARTRPAPGDNDHLAAGAGPYFDYFGAAAGPSGQGYYSYDNGSWHVISLDSDIAAGPTSAQYQWLQADLAAHPTDCAVAYWHRARFSSTRLTYDSRMKAIWKLLDNSGVDLALVAHSHVYERYAPQDADGNGDPNGIREFIVGTGGKALSDFVTAHPNSEVRESGSFGVLKLTLHDGSYSWEFVPAAPSTFTDTGTASCVEVAAPPPPAGAPAANAGGPYGGNEGSVVAFDGTGSTDPEGEVLTYAWSFGDGATGSGATVSHTYDDDGPYDATLIVTDPGGLADTASATATVSNVRPFATIVRPPSVPVNTSFTIALIDPGDPSGADTAAGFTYRFDCGSGYGPWGTASSRDCPGHSSTGTIRVRAKIRDKDRGVKTYGRKVQITAS